jgi:DNA ligase (NAD+)
MPEQAITRLRGVELGVTADGTASPVGDVDPVTMGDVVVNRASLRTAAFIRENELRLGDAISLRSGGALPVVDEVLVGMRTGGEETLRLPTHCPICECDLRQLAEDLVCPNAACAPQLAQRIARIAAADAFDIPQLDRDAIDALIAADLLTSPSDVFRLSERALVRIGWTSERAAELCAAIERSKDVQLERLLIAMTAIDGAAAASIASHARSLAAVKRLAAGSIARLPDVGTRTAEQVANFMSEPRNRRVLAQMARAGVTTLRVPVRSAR